MHTLVTWEQSPTFDPYNPNQIVRESYVGIPGGYGSFYFNKVPTGSKLQGAGLGRRVSATEDTCCANSLPCCWDARSGRGAARGLKGALSGGLDALPTWGQAVVVGGLAAVIGFYGFKYVGPKLKGKSGGVAGLFGLGRARRKR